MAAAIQLTYSALQVRDLGRMAYAPALALQREIHQQVLDGTASPTLILVEHDPVITLSHRKTAPGNLVASPEILARLGIEVAQTDRGGDITYHGPGQLVAYPILRLAPLRLMVGSYMRMLEEIVIATVAAFGVEAFRIEKCTGVWVRGRPPLPLGEGWGDGTRELKWSPDMSKAPSHSQARPPCPLPGGEGKVVSKLCALGIRVQRNVTLHGLALNVTTDLTHFATIIPCGIRDRGVTSLRELLGDRCPTMQQVKDELVRQFRGRVGAA